MRLIPDFLSPTRLLERTSRRPDKHNPDFTVGQIRSLRWQTWWMKWLPYRLYPAIPFRKVVYWHWRGHRLTLPRPWAKDIFAGLGEDD